MGVSSIASSRSSSWTPLAAPGESGASARAVTPPDGDSAQNTPSSNGRQVAFATMLATPRHSSTATTTTGKAGRDRECQFGDGVIQLAGRDIQFYGLKISGKKREAV